MAQLRRSGDLPGKAADAPRSSARTHRRGDVHKLFGKERILLRIRRRRLRNRIRGRAALGAKALYGIFVSAAPSANTLHLASRVSAVSLFYSFLLLRVPQALRPFRASRIRLHDDAAHSRARSRQLGRGGGSRRSSFFLCSSEPAAEGNPCSTHEAPFSASVFQEEEGEEGDEDDFPHEVILG